MRFPPFDHAAFLARAWADGPPRHDLGASAFQPDDVMDGLPTDIRPDDVGMLDLDAAEAFRDAVAAHVGVAPDQVLPTAGTTAANLAIIAEHARTGTNVVSERPYYAPLPHTAQGLGAEVRFVDRGAGGAIDAEHVVAAMDGDTSLVMLTSPNNPTGHADDAETLLTIAEAADRHDALVLVDQVYRELTDHPLAAALHPRLVTTSGPNKCWGAPGLRAGWIAAAPDVIATASETHRLLLLGTSRIGTRIATAMLGQAGPRRRALEARLAETHPVFEAWAQRHGLQGHHGELTAFVPAPVQDTHTLAERLARQGIVAVPGEAFGRAGHLRIGLGVPASRLQAGLDALASAWEEAGVPAGPP